MRKSRGAGQPGFTLVELLVVITVVSIVVSIVVPKFVDVSRRSRISARARNIQLLQDAVLRFASDTGVFPATLDTLAAETAPASGLNPDGATRLISAGDWHGPYVDSVPPDPITNTPYTYGTTPPNVGRVTAPSAAPNFESS